MQQQKKMGKMLDDLDQELRLSNRFFPDNELINIIHSLSGISSIEVKKGTTLFRARLIGKELESELLMPFRDSLISAIRKFVPEFCEEDGFTEWMQLCSYFEKHPLKKRKWERVYQRFIARYSKQSFWGYDEQGSDAPPSGYSTSGRANPDGIRYLYAAEDIKTAILEVRPVPTQLVSVARIELLEDIKVYSFTIPLSMGDDENDLLARAEYNEISKRFALPNYSGQSYYLATQYISEYIKHMKNPDGENMFDGLCFHSSLNSNGKNYVLFDVSDTKKYQIVSSAIYQVNDLLGNSNCILPVDSSSI